MMKDNNNVVTGFIFMMVCLAAIFACAIMMMSDEAAIKSKNDSLRHEVETLKQENNALTKISHAYSRKLKSTYATKDEKATQETGAAESVGAGTKSAGYSKDPQPTPMPTPTPFEKAYSGDWSESLFWQELEDDPALLASLISYIDVKNNTSFLDLFVNKSNLDLLDATERVELATELFYNSKYASAIGIDLLRYAYSRDTYSSTSILPLSKKTSSVSHDKQGNPVPTMPEDPNPGPEPGYYIYVPE